MCHCPSGQSRLLCTLLHYRTLAHSIALAAAACKLAGQCGVTSEHLAKAADAALQTAQQVSDMALAARDEIGKHAKMQGASRELLEHTARLLLETSDAMLTMTDLQSIAGSRLNDAQAKELSDCASNIVKAVESGEAELVKVRDHAAYRSTCAAMALKSVLMPIKSVLMPIKGQPNHLVNAHNALVKARAELAEAKSPAAATAVEREEEQSLAAQPEGDATLDGSLAGGAQTSEPSASADPLPGSASGSVLASPRGCAPSASAPSFALAAAASTALGAASGGEAVAKKEADLRKAALAVETLWALLGDAPADITRMMSAVFATAVGAKSGNAQSIDKDADEARAREVKQAVASFVEVMTAVERTFVACINNDQPLLSSYAAGGLHRLRALVACAESAVPRCVETLAGAGMQDAEKESLLSSAQAAAQAAKAAYTALLQRLRVSEADARVMADSPTTAALSSASSFTPSGGHSSSLGGAEGGVESDTTAKVMFRPVFVETNKSPVRIEFDVKVNLKVPKQKAVEPPKEVSCGCAATLNPKLLETCCIG